MLKRRYLKKVLRVGSSLGIVLDKVIVDTLGLEIGDKIVIDIVRKLKRKKEDGG